MMEFETPPQDVHNAAVEYIKFTRTPTFHVRDYAETMDLLQREGMSHADIQKFLADRGIDIKISRIANAISQVRRKKA